MQRNLTILALVVPFLALHVSPAFAQTGYVFKGDLNGDGVEDSIMSGPPEMFGNAGGPFVVTLSARDGGALVQTLFLHPEAVSLDFQEGNPRLWTYSRSSCCGGNLSAIRLAEGFEVESIRLDFDQDGASASMSRDVYEAVFHASRRIRFDVVDHYEPPPPPGGEWGK